MNSNEFMTFEELGELLRLGKTAMYAAKRRGDLPPAIKIGRNIRFRRETVLCHFEEKERPVEIDPVFAERAQKAVASRNQKSKRNNKKAKRGRPTKAEQVEG